MKVRLELHPRNRHKNEYNFDELCSVYPRLKKFVKLNEYGTLTIDFFNPQAVRALNKALLINFYGITYWNIPKDALCPPIPGRADYIHYLADLPTKSNKITPQTQTQAQPETQIQSQSQPIKVLDIGVGSNCIYPIIGSHEYGWNFVGADINEDSLKNAHKIITCNPSLAHKIELRLQPNRNYKFKGVIKENEFFEYTMCNPPFHATEEQAERNARLKLTNLKGEKIKEVKLNFGGVSNELWCPGGEFKFIADMILESKLFKENVGWFTCLVSRDKDVFPLVSKCKAAGVKDVKIVEMAQGVKVSRFIAWTFHN